RSDRRLAWRGPAAGSGFSSLRSALAQSHRRMNAVLAEAQVGADCGELLQQLAERRIRLDARVEPGLTQGTMTQVDNFVLWRVVAERRQVGADRYEAEVLQRRRLDGRAVVVRADDVAAEQRVKEPIVELGPAMHLPFEIRSQEVLRLHGGFRS